MTACYTRINNHEAVTSFFGKWPSFDDFEIMSMLLERSRNGQEACPVLTIQFFGFRSDVGPENPARKNCLLTLRFGGLESLKLQGFNHQNAINGFIVGAKWSERLNQEMFSVELVQGFGVGAAFDCGEIEVLSLTEVSG